MGPSEFSEAERRRHAATFGAAAEAYERGRPGYPDAALDWVFEAAGPEPTVCDLGAGTGKLTRSLVSRGLAVDAVEPSAEMLDQLRSAVPGARAMIGTAEQTGLPDASVDVVLVAQAWHWVDPPIAVPEVARILTDGGILGLLWNLRTEATEFGLRLQELMGGSDRDRWSHADPSEVPGSPFESSEHQVVEWSYPLTPDQLVDMVASRSYVIAMDPAPRSDLLRQVLSLGEKFAVTEASGPLVRVPYQTRSLRYRRRVR